MGRAADFTAAFGEVGSGVMLRILDRGRSRYLSLCWR